MRERIGKGGITEEREGEVTKPTEEVFGADRREAAAKPSPDLGGGFGGKCGVGAGGVEELATAAAAAACLLALLQRRGEGERKGEESNAEQSRSTSGA